MQEIVAMPIRMIKDRTRGQKIGNAAGGKLTNKKPVLKYKKGGTKKKK